MAGTIDRNRIWIHRIWIDRIWIDGRWLAKPVLCLRDYHVNKFLKDGIAGVTVGLVALPLAMAFSLASDSWGGLCRGGGRAEYLRQRASGAAAGGGGA